LIWNRLKRIEYFQYRIAIGTDTFLLNEDSIADKGITDNRVTVKSRFAKSNRFSKSFLGN